jgi:hypothetical protein
MYNTDYQYMYVSGDRGPVHLLRRAEVAQGDGADHAAAARLRGAGRNNNYHYYMILIFMSTSIAISGVGGLVTQLRYGCATCKRPFNVGMLTSNRRR